jgi:hypothetical protein
MNAAPAPCKSPQRWATLRALCTTINDRSDLPKESVMGKYFLAWLLGVPGGILLLIFLFTHVF